MSAAFCDELHLRLGDREHHFLLARLRDLRHRLAGGDHLPGLGLDRGDDAGGVGDQRGVADLVGRLALLRARRGEPRLRGGEGARAAVELGLADEVLLAQVAVALVLGLGERGSDSRLATCALALATASVRSAASMRATGWPRRTVAPVSTMRSVILPPTRNASRVS